MAKTINREGAINGEAGKNTAIRNLIDIKSAQIMLALCLFIKTYLFMQTKKTWSGSKCVVVVTQTII